jgi:hypothetical protein
VLMVLSAMLGHYLARGRDEGLSRRLGRGA